MNTVSFNIVVNETKPDERLNADVKFPVDICKEGEPSAAEERVTTVDGKWLVLPVMFPTVATELEIVDNMLLE